MPVTRGFKGRQRDGGAEHSRLPPGQYVTCEFPVLSAGPTQRTPLESWSLALQDHGKLIGLWNWAQFQALPQTERTTDIHCVTKWTKLDTRWRGVALAENPADRMQAGAGAASVFLTDGTGHYLSQRAR